MEACKMETLLELLHIDYYIVCDIMDSSFCTAFVCDWILETNQNFTPGLFHFIAKLMATLIHCPFTVPLPGLANWFAFLK